LKLRTGRHSCSGDLCGPETISVSATLDHDRKTVLRLLCHVGPTCYSQNGPRQVCPMTCHQYEPPLVLVAQTTTDQDHGCLLLATGGGRNATQITPAGIRATSSARRRLVRSANPRRQTGRMIVLWDRDSCVRTGETRLAALVLGEVVQGSHQPKTCGGVTV
jgi:hypothetical protein